MSLANELKKIPPLTRISLASAVLIAGPIFLKLMSPRPYAFYWPMITSKLQIYRLYTSIWIPWRLDDPIKWLFDMVMLYRHLKPIEENNYHRRLADMVWQFFWSMALIMLLCYPLHFPFFWSPLLGFVVYLSSKLSPNGSISLYGLITIRIQWFPYVMVAFDMAMSPMIACGTVAGLLVAHLLYMIEYNAPVHETAEPTLKQTSFLRAPGWLTRLLVEPEAQQAQTVRTVYGQATAPRGRGMGDGGRGANVPSTTSGYNWGRGHRLGDS